MHWLLEKSLIALFVTGGVGGLGYCGYRVLVPVTVEDYLRLEGAKPVNSDDDWKKIAAKHSSTGTESDNTKMPNITADNGNAESAIKEECKKLLDTTAESSDFEKNKKTAETWCTKKSPHLKEDSTAAPPAPLSPANGKQ